jgi:hypothetical protein
MFSSLLLGAALAPAAPIPQDTNPTPTGPAPWVLYLKADTSGQVGIIVTTYQKVKQTRGVVTNENGKQVVKQVQEEVTVPSQAHHVLNNMAAAYRTAAGTDLTAADVLKRAKDGVVVLVAADGKPVEKGWLRAVGPDAVVLTADVLGKAVVPPVGANVRAATAAPRLVLLGTDADGKVKVAYNPNAGAGGTNTVAFARANRIIINNGNQLLLANDVGFAPAAAPAVGVAPTKPLEEVALDAYDLTGKMVPRADALKRLKAGGMVLIAGDNRVPDAAYLNTFRGDLLVLVSAELLNVPTKPSALPGGVVRPLPIKIAPLAPAVLPVAPAVPAPAPAPAKPDADKPAEVAPAKPAVLPARPILVRPGAGRAVPLPAKPPVERPAPDEK